MSYVAGAVQLGAVAVGAPLIVGADASGQGLIR